MEVNTIFWLFHVKVFLFSEAPIDEGFHYYDVKIEGVKFNDPGDLNFYGSVRWENGIKNTRLESGFIKTWQSS